MCVLNLSDRVGQGLDNLLVRRGHHALSVNLNDPVTHTDAAALRDASSHQAANLRRDKHLCVQKTCHYCTSIVYGLRRAMPFIAQLQVTVPSLLPS